MISSAQIAQLAPYYNRENTLVEDHSVPDIIEGIIMKHHKEAAIYDRFSDQFWKGSPRATARAIYNYMANNIDYKIEPPNDQTVKSPGAIMYDRYGDCKHYASFANGVLHSLARKGYPVGNIVYRFSGYEPGNYSDVHHVFSVLQTDGKEIWIDPVVKNFDYHKPYYASQDKTVYTMPLKEISGIGAPPQWLQNIKKGAQNTVKKVQPAVMKVGAATGRNSFLLLLKVNAFNLAHRLYDFMHRSKAQEDELLNFWKQKLGGDPGTLKNNINEGMKGYFARHKTTAEAYNKSKGFINGIYTNPQQAQYYVFICRAFPYSLPGMTDGNYNRSMIGVEPASTAALMTAAAAIIAALAPILKRAGWSESDKANADNVASAGAMALSAAAAFEDGSTIPTGAVTLPNGQSTNMLDAKVNTAADGTKVVTVKDTGSLDAATGGGTITETLKQWGDSIKSTFIEYKTPLLIGGAGVLALMVVKNLSSTKKKRR